MVIELTEDQTIRLLTTEGKIVLETQGRGGINRIRLGELATGMYWLEIGLRRYKVLKGEF